MGKFKMKGTTLYGKPTGKGGFTNGDLTVSRTGNDNMADGRAKSSPYQDRKTTTKEKAKAVLGTIADTFTANEPITAMSNISKTYKRNKAYQRARSAKKNQ